MEENICKHINFHLMKYNVIFVEMNEIKLVWEDNHDKVEGDEEYDFDEILMEYDGNIYFLIELKSLEGRLVNQMLQVKHC